MGLIGVESENLQKTMVRIQSAMALSQGLQGVMEAKDQFKNLGTVLSQTAIGQGLLTAATAAYRFVQTGSFKTTKENNFNISSLNTNQNLFTIENQNFINNELVENFKNMKGSNIGQSSPSSTAPTGLVFVEQFGTYGGTLPASAGGTPALGLCGYPLIGLRRSA